MVCEAKCLGVGFGVSLVNVQLYAAKTYNPENSTHKEWISEATMMKNISHKNIIPFYGVTGNNFIIMKYMHFGTLLNFLEKNEENLSLENRHFISSAVADGLQFLHTNHIIHGDFHSGNILVGINNNQIDIRIADFGKSKYVSTEESSSEEKNPCIKPEVENFLSILLVIYPKHRILLKNLVKEHFKIDPEGLNFISTKKWIAEINQIEPATSFIEFQVCDEFLI